MKKQEKSDKGANLLTMPCIKCNSVIAIILNIDNDSMTKKDMA